MNRLYLPDAEVAYARDVLFAVELVDPVALAPVTRNVTVAAPPLVRQPLRSFSGRFVWLREGDAWPASLVVEPDPALFERATDEAPSRPADPDHPQDAELLARRVLVPARTYPFPDGVTVVRGRLVQSSGSPVQPVTDAHVRLQWFDSDSGTWSGDAASTPVLSRDAGEFAAFLRLPPSTTAPGDAAAFLRVRLRVVRPYQDPRTSPDLLVPPGRAFGAFQALAWDALN